jgi:uncharacterized delta-60 repeat protein
MALSGDRIILVASPSTLPTDYVVQLTATGQLDATFGAGGVARAGQGGLASLAVQPDGRLIVASSIFTSSFQGMYVTRLLPNGTTDVGFGSGGTASLPASVTGSYSVSNPVAVDPLGRILVGERMGPNGSGKMIIARFTPQGTLDPQFGIGGWNTSGNTLSLVVDANSMLSMTLQPDGKAVLVGSSLVTAVVGFAAARFDGDALTIGSFTANPNPVTAGTSVTLTASNITDANPGATVTQVAFYQDSNGDGILEPGTDTLLGYGVQTSPGVWTFTFSTAGLTRKSYTLFAQAEDSYDVFGDLAALTLTVQWGSVATRPGARPARRRLVAEAPPGGGGGAHQPWPKPRVPSRRPPGDRREGLWLAPYERSRRRTHRAVLAAQTASSPSTSSMPASAAGPSVWTRPTICTDHCSA